MMTEYAEFKREALYALVRNGGSLYLSDFRDMKFVKAIDALDYQLHLRQLQDERLVVRSQSQGSTDILKLGLGGPARTYVELTAAGWDWVRDHRAVEKLADPDA